MGRVWCVGDFSGGLREARKVLDVEVLATRASRVLSGLAQEDLASTPTEKIPGASHEPATAPMNNEGHGGDTVGSDSPLAGPRWPRPESLRSRATRMGLCGGQHAG